jgi:hypothetical protein
LGIIRRDSRGYALSLDLLLALIPLTIILGMVGADMDNMLYNVQDTVFRSSMDRVATDTVNALVSTSGTPKDWDEVGINNSTVIGLANYNEVTNRPIESSISASKFAVAKADFDNNGKNSGLQKMVGDSYGFFINVSTITGSQQVGNISNPPGNNATDVVRIERIVRFSQFGSVSSLENEIRYTGTGYRPYTLPTFNTSYTSNQDYYYWILMTPSSQGQMFSAVTITINNNANPISFSNINITKAFKINDYLNSNSSNIDQSLSNTLTLNGTGSFPSSINIYIVRTPTDVSADEVTSNTVVQQTCRFVFYLWAK